MFNVNKILNYFFPQTIFQTNSKFNKNIKVTQFLGKMELQVGNLQQSGSLVEKIWEKGIRTIKNYELRIKNILILGLGGGSVVPVVNKYFPDAEIIGVEIDPEIVKISKKYFDLNKQKNLTIEITDAFKYVKKQKEKYDLVLIDLYLGQNIPKKSESQEFVKDLKKILNKNGALIFNRLRGKDRENELIHFQKMLDKEFKTVKTVEPLINRLFICF